MTPSAINFYPQPIVDAANSVQGDWRGACDAVLQVITDGDRCYSSGEIARILRICAPDLRFSVPGIGGYIRDAFCSDALPEYDDGMGNPMSPLQVGRTTLGLFPNRTPSGQPVFVYGPDQGACDVAEYEVYIPRPGEDLGDVEDTDSNPATPQPPSTMPATTTPAPGQPSQAPAAPGVVLQGNTSRTSFECKVTGDFRLYLNREVFDALAYQSGLAMRGGDPVYVRVDGDVVTVLLTDDGDANNVPFTLGRTRGRIKVPNQTGSPFVPGTRYGVTVTSTEITVDLANAL